MTTDRVSYLQGQYDAYGRLLTSPRMNKAQREVITDCALTVKDELEALGVTFRQPERDDVMTWLGGYGETERAA